MPRAKKPTSTKKPAAQKPRRPRLFARKEAAPTIAAPVEARALARFVRLSPQKARLVMDLIRGRDVGAARSTLRFTNKRAALHIEKLLLSAVANAQQKSESLDEDRLYVKTAVVNDGPRWKRIRPAPFGRAYGYVRRTCHLEIGVAERSARVTAPLPRGGAAAATP
jgi:large subunit ribosomal protein L22